MQNLGKTLAEAVQKAQAGKLTEGEVLCRQILNIYPQQINTLFLMGVIAYQKHEYDQSLNYYQQALQINPDQPEIYNNLAAVYIALGDLTTAISHTEKAISLNPQYAEAYQNQGNALRLKGNLQQAVTLYQQALALQPKLTQSYNGLGSVLKELGQSNKAIAHFQKAISLNPNLAEAYNGLAGSLKLQGKIEEAIGYYQKSLELDPSNDVHHSNFLLALNYTCELSPAEIFAHHREWEQVHTSKLPRPLGYSNSLDPAKRLRIGYISPDFRIHSVAYFILPIVQQHNPQMVEIFLYSDVSKQDRLTTQFEKLAHHWRTLVGLKAPEVAKLIQEDQIDILVDLTGHTGENRLVVLGYKPAPIQVTYLGYPNTTGLSTVDYRLTDGYADPLGRTESYHSEKLFRLSHCFLCYQPLSEPPLSEPPCLSNGYITFGSFNNLAKVTHQVVATWAAILRAVPRSKLMLKYRGLGEVETQQRWLELFAQHDIGAERLLLTNRIPVHSEHLSAYNQIDIGLDPFPYNGTTTTFEALWMGVPVIVLAGKSHVGRVGVSILSNLGLFDWIAPSLEGYVELATQKAQQPELLSKLRLQQRELMKQSPLLNSKQFTEKLEAAYRLMWSNYLI